MLWRHIIFGLVVYPALCIAGEGESGLTRSGNAYSVSYTHLTLPTILLV